MTESEKPKNISCLFVILAIVAFCVVMGLADSIFSTLGAGLNTTAGSTVYQTKTKIFSGLTPGENLAEWKEDFPERTVVRFEIGLDSNGKPIELKIWYTK